MVEKDGLTTGYPYCGKKVDRFVLEGDDDDFPLSLTGKRDKRRRSDTPAERGLLTTAPIAPSSTARQSWRS